MFLQVMLSTHTIAGFIAHPWADGNPVIARASLSIPDTLFLFVVALVVFGPKRLPEIGKQIGKLVFEFRRASNDFKLQIEEELRVAEQQDRQKQIEVQAAAKPSTPAVEAMQIAANARPTDFPGEPQPPASPEPPDRTSQFMTESTPETKTSLTVNPPSTGTPVSALPPNHTAMNAPSADPAPAEIAPTEIGTHHG